MFVKRGRESIRAALLRVGSWLIERVGMTSGELEDGPTDGYSVEVSAEGLRLVEEGRFSRPRSPAKAPEGPARGSVADRVRRSRGAQW